MRSAIWINFVLGIWLILAPWVLGYMNATAKSEDVVFGAAVILVSLWIANAPMAGAGALWTLIVFSVWIFIAPWILGNVGYTNAMANDIAVAIVIFIVTVSLLARSRIPGGHPGGGLE